MISYWLFGLLLLAQLFFARLSTPQFVLGMLAWTLLEYSFHRFAFHSNSMSRYMRPFNDGKHLMHHRRPGSLEHMTVPIVFALPTYAAVFGLYYLLTSLNGALSFGSGIVASYLCYELTHLMAHRGHPKLRILKSLKRYHMEHHFMNEQTRFGVTSPMWDYFFNTMKSEEDEDL